MNQLRELRAAIIGCGDIAFRKYIHTLKIIPGVQIVSFCSRTEAHARAARIAYGNEDAVIVSEPDGIFNDPRIDMVFICTPNNSHAQYSIRALEVGKHVMCEKPMALTSADCARMIQAADKSGAYLTVGYQNRFKAEAQYIHKLCSENYFGQISHIEINAIRRRGIPTWGNFLDKTVQGGGALIDIGSHVLDLGLWFLNNYQPLWVCCKCYSDIAKAGSQANRWGEWDPKVFSVEDSAYGFILMGNNTTLTINVAWAVNTSQESERHIKIFGSKAGVELKNGIMLSSELYGGFVSSTIELTPACLRLPGKDAEPISASAMQVYDFVQAIREQRPPIVNPWQTAVVTTIIEALYKSDQRMQPVHLQSVL